MKKEARNQNSPAFIPAALPSGAVKRYTITALPDVDACPGVGCVELTDGAEEWQHSLRPEELACLVQRGRTWLLVPFTRDWVATVPTHLLDEARRKLNLLPANLLS